MLQAERIRYRYSQQIPLLEGLSMTIRPGEVVGLPGPSGCGKSTLGRLLSGYVAPQSGTIRCEEGVLPQKGYCPVQMIFQHPELAVDPRWKIRRILQEGNRMYKELLQPFGVHENWLERFPHELSGGELQRVTLIRVMNPSTRYLIADEMTASLDPGTQALIWQAVLQWAKMQRVGILAISHDVSLLGHISDRIDTVFM